MGTGMYFFPKSSCIHSNHVLLQSWFIGKVPSSSGTPATPSAANAPNLSVNDQDSRYGDLSATQQAQVSPMSSAFPPIQSRTAAVV